jgi:phosphoenolpyruvate-protein phosphotransferase (PTS system enzyme I)
MRAKTQRNLFQGIPICDGLAVGQLIVACDIPSSKPKGLVVIAPDNEWEKYHQAKLRALDQIRTMSESVKSRNSSDVTSEGADVLDVYSSVIGDEELVRRIKSLVFDEALGASEAVAQAFKDVREVISAMQSPHIRDKALDLDACEDMLLSELCDNQNLGLKNEPEIKGKIVAIHQPLPQEIIQLHKAGVAGIIAESGSKLSHAAILAKSFNIPSVFGASGVIRAASKNARVILDATVGQVSLNPSRSELRKAEARKAVGLMLQQKLKAGAQSIARTIDGHRVLVFANTEASIDSRFYATTGAEGIGLLRTEFLHLPHSGGSPSAFVANEESLKTYFQTISEVSSGRWVTIRLLDCGGDKPFPSNYDHHLNSSLNDVRGVFGLRGVRFLLSEERILKAQLKSIIRANTLGNIRVLIPFVTDVEEIRQVKNRLRRAWEELSETERSVLHFPSLGAMIETPAAVQLLDFITSECDFVSVGSNDLTQHLLCVERDKPVAAGQFSLFHPAVLRCLKTIFDHQKVSSTALSICGEIASEPAAVELLIGLGCQQLSARPSTIPLIKEIVRSIDLKEAQEFALSILKLASATEIERCLKLRFEEKHGTAYSIPRTSHRAS